MLTKPRREVDDHYWKTWIRDQEEWACLLTGYTGPEVDGCHLQSRGSGGSDYWVYPLLHELHMQVDHTPRGEQTQVKKAQLRQELALWFYHLPAIHKRYYLEQTTDRQNELMKTVTFQTMAALYG